MHIGGYDVTEWSSLISFIGGVLTVVGVIWGYRKSTLKQRDEHTKQIAKAVSENQNKQLMSLQISFDNFGTAINELKQVIEGFRVTEQDHFNEHEKRLVKHDLELQKDDDAIEDHEDRIKSNEDDIDYLKQQVGSKKNG